MSINHIGTAELDGNFKTLKINNVPLVVPPTPTPTQEFITFAGLVGTQALRYLVPWSASVATPTAYLENQVSPFKPIKIVGMVCRKSNPLPSTSFTVYKSDINLANFQDLQTVTISPGNLLTISPVLNIPVSSGECLWVRTSSGVESNPDYTQVTILYEQV
jgi:hypothetical protein